MTPTKICACLVFFLSLVAAAKAAPPSDIILKKDMIITANVRISPGNYTLNGNSSLQKPVIRIQGNNITVDFNNAILHGSNDKQLPNEFYGVALLITGNNITLKNARISGFKVAVLADSCKNLVIQNCDFSYNYRQQLQSTWLHEDVSDWMSYHHNEQDEWLRYGAGIYLKDCKAAKIKNNRITGSQCALMMMRTSKSEVTDNDFSFNSGIGIGMYRSSGNNILHNKLDFNVRGQSFGFYNRGQDSAGLLLFEQCNDNVIAFNSVTHSGDGLFLWAGQTTMDTGEGGCNNNYIYKNDFSYAPTNGVEVTFSKNTIADNIINECDHGVWGGYSWQTSIIGNLFYKNRIGIAIEHGQNNAICNNIFDSNKTAAVKLWARKTQPPDWGYAQKRDTRSMQYTFWNNRFRNESVGLDITLTDNIVFDKNLFENTKTQIRQDSSVQNLVIDPPNKVDSAAFFPSILRTWKKREIPQNQVKKGRDQIKITEWGPYDFRYPIIFLKKVDSTNLYYFDIMGPAGKFNLKNTRGFRNLSITQGRFPAELTAEGSGSDLQLNFEYTGPAFTDQFGNEHQSGKPYTFSFRDFKPQIDWNVQWFSWDTTHDPNRNYESFKTIFNNTPLKTETAQQLDYTWWGQIGRNLPADSFAVVANGQVNLPEGFYSIEVTADDLVKVFVDDKAVIDFWDAALYKYDEDTHHRATVALNGKHNIRIEMVENTGYATLIFKIKPIDK